MKKRWKVQVPAVAMSFVLASGSMLPALAGQIPEVQSQKELAWKNYFNVATASDATKATASDAIKKPMNDEDEFFVYASDLDWVSVKVGWKNAVKDMALDGIPLVLIDEDGELVTYEKGIFVHANSEVVYDISDKGIVGFKAYVGVNYDGDNEDKGSCSFKVYADNSLIKETGVIKRADEQEYIDVSIPSGTKKITLVTTDGGDGNSNDHSIWADAMFIQDPEIMTSLNRLELDIDEVLIPVTGTAKVTVEAFLGDGSKVDLDADDVEVTYESSDDTIATIDENGNIVGLADGKVTITCFVTKGEVTLDVSTDIVIGKGDENTWFIESPDGRQEVLFVMNKDNGVNYSAFKDGEAIIKNSHTGIKTSLGDFSKGLTFIDMDIEEEIYDSYDLLGAKTSFVENYHTEMTLNFVKEEVDYQIIVRVYNDGFGLRYAIPSSGIEGEELKIFSEGTGFQLPFGSTSYVSPYSEAHEQVYYKKTNNELTESYAIPLLFETGEGTWGLIGEAALSAEYCGGRLSGYGNGLAEINFAPEQKDAVVTTVPFESPWRFVVVGELEDIHENTMAENLSPACVLDDTSWIVPGVTAWTWLNGDPVGDGDTYKKYIDMAAEMGWEYVLMDDGWQPNRWVTTGDIYHRAFYDWTDEVIAYAEEKGVGLLAWAHHNEFKTSDQLRALELWADMGIKGIKIDYFDSQAQDVMLVYDLVMKKTAECELLLNPHGSNKASGERRTYPQSLTREGVYGAEYHRVGQGRGLTSEYICYLPFTRYAVGPADYTPLLSYQWVDQNAFTISQMAAHTIIFESGIQCLADKPSVYLSSPAKKLLTNLPASWDESHLLDGYPGEFVSIARRSGDDWYIGMACDDARDAEVDLSFLEDGTHYAFIYKDGETNKDIDTEVVQVTNEDTITIPLAKSGGASVKIVTDITQPDSIVLSETEVTLEQYECIELQATLEPEGTEFDRVEWKSSDEKVVTVKDGKLTAVRPGTAEITASTGVDNSITATCTVTVVWPKYALDKNVWTLVNENRSNWKLNSENSLTIVSEAGEYGNTITNAKNVFYMDVTGDFTVSTKLSFEPEDSYQSAGFVIYSDGKALVEVLRRYHQGFGGNIFATVNIWDGGFKNERTLKDNNLGTDVYLKATREGTKFTGYISWDNEEWIPIGESVDNPRLTNQDLKIGLYSVNGLDKGGAIPATFEDFTYEKDGVSTIIPFAIEVDEDLEILKANLEDLIDSCEGYDAKDYTKESYKALTDALEAAADAIADQDVSPEVLTKCYNDLQDAIAGLKDKEEVDEDTWSVNSPDGSQVVVFTMNENGGVDYAASKDGKVVVENSYTGIKTNLGDFSKGLTFVDSNIVEGIEDSYELLGARTSYVETEYTEMTLNFVKEDVKYQIIVRVYDDGFGFRYAIPISDGEKGGEGANLEISSESSGFQLPKDSVSYVSPYTGYHEQPIHKKTDKELTESYAIPLLFGTDDGTWGLIGEAALSGTYCGGRLSGRGNGLVEVNFAPEQTKNVVTTVPFESPWRFVVIGDLADITENTMAENLSPECQIDTSWIEPGVTGWTWLNKDPVNDRDTYMRYIDMAAEMGWEYVLMDDGWQPGGWTETDGIRHRAFYDWTEELIAYADEKGVGLLAWANHNEFKTPEQQRALEIWAKMGIKGIKIDFFDSQSQEVMIVYDQLMEKTAECELLLNCHGSNKASGERRTYPQSLTREGVLGAEHHRQWGKPYLTAEYNCLLPFTRYAVGPADYTPLMSYDLVSEDVFTVSQMAAHSIILESGLQCLADKPDVYLSSPAKSLLKNLPVTWDESHLLDGYPGEYVNIARRAGDDWYIGIICDEARDANVDLSFLGEGTYYATIYKDGATNTDIDIEKAKVTKDSVLTIPLAKGGGASVKIVTEAPILPSSITLSEETVTIEQYEFTKIEATVEPEGTDIDYVVWESSNETIATVNNGTITAIKPGTAEITVYSGIDSSVNASCTVTVTSPKYVLDENVWTLVNNNRPNWKLNSENSLTIVSESGEYGNTITNAKNVFYMDVMGDFSVSTKLSFEPKDSFQSAGFVIYSDGKAIVEVLRRYHGSFGGNIFATVNIWDGGFKNERTLKDNKLGTDVYLKVTREGTKFTGYISWDNEEWTPIGESVDNPRLANQNLKIGLYSVNGLDKGGAIPATFENVTYEKDGVSRIIPFVAEEDEELEILKTDLEDLIDSCKAYDEEDYTEESFKALTDALEAAADVLTDKDVTKEELSKCLEDLQTAIDGLELKEEVDKELEALKESLKTLIDSCKVYDKDVYTESSYKALTDALKASNDALANKDVTKAELSKCIKNLQAAIDGLEMKEEVDKELEALKVSLKKLIDSCKAYDKDVYTESSYKALTDALKASNDALSNKDVTKAELSKCLEDLQAAIDGLEMKEEVDKELETLKVKLTNLVDSCKAYKEKDYTAGSYKALTDAVDAANKVLANKDVTKAELTACYDNLQEAIKGLTKKPTTSEGSKGSSGSSTTTVTSGRWVQDATGWWYKNPDGSWPKAQWLSLKENGKNVWYYFGNDGYMRDGWLELNGKTYFLHNISDGTRGSMYTGWHLINERWYYFEEKEGTDQGRLYVNSTTPDGYQVDEYGVWMK